MTIDLTGGLDAGRELLFADRPDDPEVRESVNAWAWDGGGAVGLPRIGVEAMAERWGDTADVQINIAAADGRVVNVFAPGAVHDRAGPDGRPVVLGAGPLAFSMVEPFRSWRATIDGAGTATTVQAQIGGWMPGSTDGEQVPIFLDLALRSVVPPWEVGSLTPEAGRVLATQEEGDLMGGPRFEQLCRATGTLRLGDEEHAIDGGALRIRRSGVRRLATFWGHVWQSGLFASGRAFGCNTYPSRDDGKPTLNEGYLFEGDGALLPARVVRAPWLRSQRAKGDDVTVVLETEAGTTTITGETTLATCMVMPPEVGGGLNLQQALARYTWDGEEGMGMVERSMPFAKMAAPA